MEIEWLQEVRAVLPSAGVATLHLSVSITLNLHTLILIQHCIMVQKWKRWTDILPVMQTHMPPALLAGK